ncbi:leucine-rich repeat protein shoc-2 [Plakobranchus ocellatus]|uniref:Leucine-rich repeat protein shoc-2 n=1 Tax=Plakobranchus ocellatus TaxID=259542 RepID=A0AAV4DVH1_9GAST|nr:leucine-rich repeat protein shoc-2 [Plakobranchus ocellatus]
MALILRRIQDFFLQWTQRDQYNDNGISKIFKSFHSFVEYVEGETLKNAETVANISVVSYQGLQNPQVPVSIGRFTQLSFLQMRGCVLSTLPWSIVYLKQLKYFDLSYNQFQTLPSLIGYLSNLLTLNMEHNKLVVLPTSLLQLTNLKELMLNGNENLVFPDYNICKQGLKAIFDNISRRRKLRNLWSGSRVTAELFPVPSGVDKIPSLFYLAAATVSAYQVDFLSAPYVPPRLKTYLVEEQRFGIQLAKCSGCRGFFSNTVLFEGHVCRGPLHRR